MRDAFLIFLMGLAVLLILGYVAFVVWALRSSSPEDNEDELEAMWWVLGIAGVVIAAAVIWLLAIVGKAVGVR